MNYQVWTKGDYEGWQKVDCGDAPAVQREIWKAIKNGQDPMVTVEVPYDLNIKLKEALIGEVKKGATRIDKGARVESKGEVRSGDSPAVQELDK